jgi:hypothetical protein
LFRWFNIKGPLGKDAGKNVKVVHVMNRDFVARPEAVDDMVDVPLNVYLTSVSFLRAESGTVVT